MFLADWMLPVSSSTTWWRSAGLRTAACWPWKVYWTNIIWICEYCIVLYYLILHYITLYYIILYYIILHCNLYIYTHHVYTHNVGALLIRPLGSHDLVRFGHRKYLPASFQVELWRCSWWLWPSYGSLHFEMFSAYCTMLSSTIYILYTVYTYIHI